MREAMPHQRRLLRKSQGQETLGLFWEMRLGKTLTTIRWALQYPPPRLVVAPYGALCAWRDELSLEGSSAIFLDADTRAALGDDFRPKADWYLVNYEGLSVPRRNQLPGYPRDATPSSVAQAPWSVVILDESAMIRNPQAIRTKICNVHLARAKRRAILTGLPNPESPLDFFEQMCFLDGVFLGYSNYWAFRLRYFQPDRMGYRWIAKVGTFGKIKAELRGRVHRLRRKNVGMPDQKVHEKRVLPMPKASRTAYDEMEKDFATGQTETKWSIVQHNHLCRIASGLHTLKGVPTHERKLRELRDLLRGELRRDHVVIWYRFTIEGAAIADLGRRLKRPTGWIQGSVPALERKQLQARFARSRAGLLVCQLNCARYGVDLSCASTAVYFSHSPSCETFVQSQDRIIHPQKKEPALFVHLLMEDTVDVDLYDALKMKRVQAAGLLRAIQKRRRQRV